MKTEPRIIHNFGLFWERSEIDWGKQGPGNKGGLWGYATSPSVQVDFREQRGIYVLYEGLDIASHRVSYLGQAGSGERDLFHRLRDHAQKGLWNRWQRFSWFGFLKVGGTRSLTHRKKSAIGNIEFPVALDQMEAVTMELLEPLKNKQGPKWRGAVEYFQLRLADLADRAQ